MMWLNIVFLEKLPKNVARFGLTSKTGKAFPKTGVVFFLCGGLISRLFYFYRADHQSEALVMLFIWFQ